MLYTGRLIRVRETMLWLSLDLLRPLGDVVSRKWKDNPQVTPTPWPPERVPRIYHSSGK